jgi:hypothetical protein
MPPGQRQAATKREQRQHRQEAARQAALQRQRRHRLFLIGGVAAGVVVIATVVTLIVANTGNPGSGANTGNAGTSQAAGSSQPVDLSWPAPPPQQTRAAVAAAGLPLLSMEATDVHFHAHLDIIVNGQSVAVPADIGIAAQDAISSMHTHDATGIIHIESPSTATFSLGQFFTEWQIPLSTTCIKTVCNTASSSWRFYVNGQAYTGDPTHITLAAHQEIAVVYGTPPPGGPPTSYTFPAGL